MNINQKELDECEAGIAIEDFVGCGINYHIVNGNSVGLWPEEQYRLALAQIQAPTGNSVVLGSHNGASEVLLGLANRINHNKDEIPQKIFGVDIKFGEYRNLNLSRLKSRYPEQEVISWEMDSKDFGEVYGEFTQEPIGLALLDSYHSFKHVISEFAAIKPYLINDSIVLFHDASPKFPKKDLYKVGEIDILDNSENFLIDEAISFILQNEPDFEEFEIPGPKCEHFQETGLTKWVRGTTSPFNSLAAIKKIS
jgi:hypothetical protein